jgi:hypothetical protein
MTMRAIYHKRVFHPAGLVSAVVALLLLATPLAAGAALLVPMDFSQTDHLKAYGLAYWCLEQGQSVEWLLNYRGGSFLLNAVPENEREARIRGISTEEISGSGLAAMYSEIEQNNMETVLLEKVPKIAVYVPPNVQPWDDAVTLALEYAEIPYTRLWDDEVLAGDLENYDWLHLHHEDFTGQYGKFYASFRNAQWYKDQQILYERKAREAGFESVSEHKKAVARKIKEYIGKGGFVFAMCSATDSFDIALASEGVDIVDKQYDGDPPDPDCQSKLDYSKTLAFTNFVLEMNPLVYEFSDIDTSNQALARGPDREYFTLFEFSAKQDPVPTMLTQCHVSVINGFLGQTTGFNRDRIKESTVILGEVENTEEIKYIHGNYGRGTFTFLGGHDPEDYQHAVGDPPTDLSLHKNSPGYRLILNNILFPAAERKEQKT